MKPIKFLLFSAMMFAVLTISATSVTEPAKTNTSEFNQMKQCGVTNAQITSYLQNCSHHHTVYWVRDITGTCNSLAGIESCDQATVIVSDGSIISHQDQNYNCPQ